MIHLEMLPLEDLAVGLFPQGAIMTNSGRGFNTELEIIDFIRDYRTKNRIRRFEVAIEGEPYRSVPRSKFVMRKMDYGSMFGQTKLVDLHAYDLPNKPFLLRLPMWLSFETMYDAIDFDHTLIDSFSIASSPFNVQVHRHESTSDLFRLQGFQTIKLRVIP